MRRYFTVVLVGISVSISAIASIPFYSPLDILKITQFPQKFVFGLSGYLLRPSTNNRDLVYSNAHSGDSSSTRGVQPDYDVGCGVNLSYILCDADISFDYLHLSTKDKDSVTNFGLNGIKPVNNIFNFPFNLPAYLGPDYHSTASAEATFNLNQIDLYSGRFTKTTHKINLHPFAGLRWVQLNRDINSHYLQTTTLSNQNTIIQSQNVYFTEKNRFQGIGPLVGFDVNYCFTNNLGLVGHFYAALLIGKIKTSVHELITQELTIDPVNDFISDTANVNPDSVWRIAPVAEAKLAAHWTWPLKRTVCSKLMLEAGWQLMQYYNVCDRLQTNTIIQNGFVDRLIKSITVSRRFSSDCSFNGPYISLTLRT